MYYVIVNGEIIKSQSKDILEEYYTNVQELPSDYEQGKYIVENNTLVLNPNFEEEKAQREAERIAQLHLTKREVFLGLRKAKDVLPEQIRSQITDPDALIEFDYATEYYRGNPLIDMVGNALGLNKEQLDKFFETNDYLYLTDCTLTINPTPVEAIVKINNKKQNSITVPYGTEVKYSVSLTGYKATGNIVTLLEDTTIEVVLETEEPKEVANE